MKNRITHVIKRTGRMVLFNEAKVVQVVWKAMDAEGEGTKEDAEEVAELVIQKLNKDFPEKAPTVEDVQDRVEMILMREGYLEVAKHYIVYRFEHTKIREAEMKKIPYMVVLGPKEAEAGKVSVRSKKKGGLGSIAVESFLEELRREIDQKI